jgi:hypothetical protein
MNQPLLVRVMDRVADLHEQLEPVGHLQPAAIAKLRNLIEIPGTYSITKYGPPSVLTHRRDLTLEIVDLGKNEFAAASGSQKDFFLSSHSQSLLQRRLPGLQVDRLHKLNIEES